MEVSFLPEGLRFNVLMRMMCALTWMAAASLHAETLYEKELHLRELLKNAAAEHEPFRPEMAQCISFFVKALDEKVTFAAVGTTEAKGVETEYEEPLHPDSYLRD